ncbi:HD domain-containing protein [Psychrosphaera haliotis]|uniref:HD domain-containing protein n=1 Tax=Psychrosphaera haliotis TaxID=555083 RepID=A0A6N8FA59_9GAMM|nr:HD domain-containing protein [Psychrosphaera haliotis]MUH71672.1 HD domain-containing protein [Psychrosphaera haliotis]
MNTPLDLERQFLFIHEMDLLKAVKRKALIKADNNRYENSAEHSWHICMAAQVLQSHVNSPVDIMRVTQMLLIHDIVEIDAGDTFAFAPQEQLDAQFELEEKAAKRIFGILPDTQRDFYLELFTEFEESFTSDAKFAKAIDRILPLVQNMQNNGGSWAANNVKRSQVLARNIGLKEVSDGLWDYVEKQINKATENGWLLNE